MTIEENETQVVFKSADGSKVKKYYKNQDWFALPTWINNNVLAFVILRTPDGIPPVVAIDPVKNEYRVLPSKFPNLKPFDGPGRVQEHFISSSMVYDPTLKYVVYPKTIIDETQAPIKHSIVLWDRNRQKALAELPDEGNFYHNPVWSLDGEQFYVAVKKNITDEIFRVNLKGEISQLSDFGKDLSGLEIGVMSLSPDGRQLAFWISAMRPGALEELAIIDLESKKVTDYCVPATLNFGGWLIWSPDSRFVAIEDYKETNHLRTILIDTQDHWAAEIDYVRPAGWLK